MGFLGRELPAEYIVCTGKATRSYQVGLTIRHATASTSDPSSVTENPANPIFTPSSDRDAWDCDGVLTLQIIEIGDVYSRVYAGKKGKEWQTGWEESFERHHACTHRDASS